MGGSQPFSQVPQTFPTMGSLQPSTQETNPKIEMVPETQSEPVIEGFYQGIFLFNKILLILIKKIIIG
ncbi:hypothetical protein Hanom_Chr06g00503591 [Helianthus anomalus]